ncbi:G2/mitotic-specific cyclin-B3-like isoform X1 [Hyposmocoma kahamanoa]|uniref:G2/mitotic-specific cyclin-B3-like isoform X1 n=1 Tax=Hyposmocoma kahamanoa TaxID=1477025 RepID=UPI000E6D8762|nr:G2/mitotic-specific cyclin-B3-like isoform X1 [Hyposmocoma kahamanoa]
MVWIQGILLVQAFHQISCRHIENQQPEDSVSNEKIQHQLQDLLLPLFQPNDEGNVGNVLNIIPYTDRKRAKSKKDTPMTIILTTNLSEKGKKKGKKDVVIAVQALNSYGAPLPDIGSLLNLSHQNTTESIESSRSLPSASKRTNNRTSEWLENEKGAHNIAEDENIERSQIAQNRYAKKRHHHAISKNKGRDDQNIQRYQKPKHIEINLVRAVHSNTAEQLSTEEEQSARELTAELSSAERKASTSELASSAEQSDMTRQLSTAEQSDTVEESSTIRLPSAAEKLSNVGQSNIPGKTSTTEEPITVEEHSMSEELSTLEQHSTELRAAKHQSISKQTSTKELQSSSEQLNTAEESSTMEKSSTAEESSTTLKPNIVEQRSATMEPGTAERPRVREEHSTAEHSSVAEQSSSSEQPSTVEQTNNLDQSHSAEQPIMAELINITEQRANIEIDSQEKKRNIRTPGGQSPATINQNTSEDSITPDNTVTSRPPIIENINVAERLEEQIDRDLEEQITEKYRAGKITGPWGPMSAEESTEEKRVTSEVTSKLISKHHSVADIFIIRGQIQPRTGTVEESTTEKFAPSELVLEDSSDVPSKVKADEPSVAEVTSVRHTPTTEKINLQWEPITPKPITSEVTQEQQELSNDGITMKQYSLENEPGMDEYTEEQLENSIISEVTPEQFVEINGETLREQYYSEHKPKNAENTKEEPSAEAITYRRGETSEESTTSEVTVIRKRHRKGKKPTDKTLLVSQAILEQLGLVNGDTLEKYNLEHKQKIAENTEESRTEEELEGISVEPVISDMIVTRNNYRKGKKTRQKSKSVPIEEFAAAITPEQLGLEQYILENKHLMGEEVGEEFVADRIREELEDNYEELIPNISLLRDYDAYDNPVAEPAALSDAETSNLFNMLLRQTEIDSLLNAQNDGERLESKTQPLVIVVPKNMDCSDKEKNSHDEEKLLRDEDILKRLNWDSHEIPLDVRDGLEQDVLNQDLLNSRYILRNENKNNALLSQENDIRQDNLHETISRYDKILRNSGGDYDAGDGHGGADDGRDLYPEQEERLGNHEISKQIAKERLANINHIDTMRTEDNKEVVKSYNLSFTFNRK